MSFFAELKRRNVIRMAGLYLVGAWLIVQIAETLLPAFDVPGWVLRAVIILLAIGFWPALIVIWLSRVDQGFDEWLTAPDNIHQARENWYSMRTVWLPSASARRKDPRLFKIAEKRGVVKLWESRGYPPSCSRVRGPNGDHLACPGMRP